MDSNSAVLVLIAGETSHPTMQLSAIFDYLSELYSPNVPSPDLVDQIALLERIRGVLAAQQARAMVEFETQQREQQIADNWNPRDVGKGIGEQIGLARRTSPSGGAVALSFARSLTTRFPKAFQELRYGRVSEQACKTLVAKTSHLSDEQATLVDAELAPLMPGWNLDQTEKAVCSAAYKIDPHGWVERRRHAERERRVWIRPAPDTMSIISALLPAAQGVAVFASLTKAANTAVGVGDERGLGQVMADTLVERVTGQTSAPEIPAEVLLTVTPETLFGGGDEPAWLQNYGVIPAELARAIATGYSAALTEHCGGSSAHGGGGGGGGGEAIVDSWYPLAGQPTDGPPESPTNSEAPRIPGRTLGAEPPKGQIRHKRRRGRTTELSVYEPGNPGEARVSSGHHRHGTACAPPLLDPEDLARADVWIRRVLTDPITGIATDIDQRKRRFDGVVRRLITIRDRECRGPFCSASIRENDHIIPWAEGGLTSADNGQGVCQRNNQLKELKGWTVTKTKKTGEVLTRTPTGHTYRTSPPAQIGYPAGTIADPSPRRHLDFPAA